MASKAPTPTESFDNSSSLMPVSDSSKPPSRRSANSSRSVSSSQSLASVSRLSAMPHVFHGRLAQCIHDLPPVGPFMARELAHVLVNADVGFRKRRRNHMLLPS